MEINRLQKHDWLLTIIIFILFTISGILIFSTTYNTTSESEGAGSFPKHLVFIIVGLIIYFSLIIFDVEWLRQKMVLAVLYIVILLLLIYLKIFGVSVAETQRWIQIGFINIQPSEYAKILIVLVTSLILSSNVTIPTINFSKYFKSKSKIFTVINDFISQQNNVSESTIRIFISLIAILPIYLLIFIQPAFGNSSILFIIWLLMVYTTLKNQLQILFLILNIILFSIFTFHLYNLNFLYGKLDINGVIKGFDIGIGIISILLFLFSVVKLKFRLNTILVIVLFSITVYPIIHFTWDNILKPYQKDRIESYIKGPQSDKYGAGYQVTQSQNTLGSGQLDGRGYLQGSQSSLKILDFAYTDFIYASLGEQFGFIGTVFVLIMYFIMVIRIIGIAQESNDVFYTLTCTGVAIMILLNMFINIGMNIGILPVTGVPLPLISYGGNSVIVNIIGLGIVQSIKVRIDSNNKVAVVSKNDTFLNNDQTFTDLQIRGL